MSRASHDHLPLLRHWEHTINHLLDRTEGFPKRVRYSFVARIDNAALDVLEELTLARYAKAGETLEPLRRADQALQRLKVLLRLAHARKHLGDTHYARLSELIEEAGSMLGGWIKALATPSSER